jgi:hypothetical protein
LVVLILENLPPIRVGAPDSHVSVSSVVLNVEGLVVISGSDGQRLLVEVPNLGSSAIWNLDDHISIVDEVKISVVWKLGNNVEISFNIETESLVELSLGRFSLPLVNIHDIPLLMDLVVSTVNSNVSVLLVDLANNF